MLDLFNKIKNIRLNHLVSFFSSHFSKKVIKNKSGQSLLLVIIVSLISFVIVIGIFDRTYKQLNVQRQNSEYNVALNTAEGAVQAVFSLIQSGELDPTVAQTTQPDLSGVAKFLDPAANNTKITIDRFDLAQDVPINTLSDSSVVVAPLATAVGSKIDKIRVWCPLQYLNSSGTATNLANSTIAVQPIYRDALRNATTDNIFSTCAETLNQVNGGPNWQTPSSIGPATDVKIPMPDGSIYTVQFVQNIALAGTNFRVLDYILPASRTALKIDTVVITPKVQYNCSTPGNCVSNSIPLALKMYLAGNLVGGSNPVTGTVIGYGNSARSSTIRFSIPNTSQVPGFFNYVMFEGI